MFRFRTLELSASVPGLGDRPVLLKVKDAFEYFTCHFSRLRKPRMVLKPDLLANIVPGTKQPRLALNLGFSPSPHSHLSLLSSRITGEYHNWILLP